MRVFYTSNLHVCKKIKPGPFHLLTETKHIKIQMFSYYYIWKVRCLTLFFFSYSIKNQPLSQAEKDRIRKLFCLSHVFDPRWNTVVTTAQAYMYITTPLLMKRVINTTGITFVEMLAKLHWYTLKYTAEETVWSKLK